MSTRKIVLGVACAVIVAVAAIFIIHTLRPGGMPAAVAGQVQALVDTKTKKLCWYTLAQMSDKCTKGDVKIDAETGTRMYMNPNTHEYTLVDRMTCPSCHMDVHIPVAPPSAGESQAAFEAWLKTAKCPACGAPLFP